MPGCTLQLEQFESRCVPSISLVKDIVPNGSSSPYELIRKGDEAYFFTHNSDGFSNDNQHYGLWTTDGTETGTQLVKEIISPAFAMFPQNLTVVGDLLFFSAKELTTGEELWVSNGTESGTKRLQEISDGSHSFSSSHFIANGNELLFTVRNHLGQSIWKSDGTAAGTQLIRNILTPEEDGQISNLTVVNGKVYFSAEKVGENPTTELWISDETESGTIKLKTFPGVNLSSNFAVMNGTLYFAGNDEAGIELWRSGGTISSTMRVADIKPGADSSTPSHLTVVNGTLYFAADSNSYYNHELWKSDGTAAGTLQVIELNRHDELNSNSLITQIQQLTAVGTNLFFSNGAGLWKLNDETDELRMIKAIRESSSFDFSIVFNEIADIGNGVLSFLVGGDGRFNAPEIWFYDSITDSVVQATEFGNNATFFATSGVLPLQNMSLLTALDSPYRFSAGTYGYELWKLNLAPNVHDDQYSVTPNSSLHINGTGVLSNDHDMEGDSMQAVLVDEPAQGTVQLLADGSFQYTPDAGYVGADQFTYRAHDSENESAIATVKLLVGVPAVPPTISAIHNQTIYITTQVVIPFTIHDDITPADNLSIAVESVNPFQFPNSAITLGGSGANRTLTLQPNVYNEGFTTIVVKVTDEFGLSTVTTFNVGIHRLFNPIAASSVENVSIFQSNGDLSSTFIPFPDQPGAVTTAMGDFNGDYVLDIAVGSGPGGPPHVKIFDGKTMAVLLELTPFETSFTGGVFVATGDINGDGKADLAITPNEGGGPRCQVIDGSNFRLIADFFGIDDPNFRGGARAAIGDVNDDGKGDLMIAAGSGGGPRVAVYNGWQLSAKGGPKLIDDFFVLEDSLRNGIFIASGDVNGDGFADLVAGSGPGGGPRVLILDGKSLVQNGNDNLVPIGNFFAGDENNRSGVRVAVKILDADRNADIVVGVGSNNGSKIKAYLGKKISIQGGTPPAILDIDTFAGSNGGMFVG